MKYLAILLFALVGCKDRRPPLPTCPQINVAATTDCDLPTPLDCTTDDASEAMRRCIVKATAENDDCIARRQAFAVCTVRHH